VNDTPKFSSVISLIASSGDNQLRWGLPEPWLHAEVFSELSKQAPDTGWQPFDAELPYLTYFPVSLPKPENRNWKEDGAFKYVDLCLRSEDSQRWCWIEFKVRHPDEPGRELKGAKSALDAMAKDFVGLAGMDIEQTASNWVKPDGSIDSYWLRNVLSPQAEELRAGAHRFVSIFLQLRTSLHPELFSVNAIRERIQSWHRHRCKQSMCTWGVPTYDIEFQERVAGQHSLVICRSNWVKAYER
jgi:hypothetical protein